MTSVTSAGFRFALSAATTEMANQLAAMHRIATALLDEEVDLNQDHIAALQKAADQLYELTFRD